MNNIVKKNVRKGRPKGSKNRKKILSELTEGNKGIIIKGNRIFSEEHDLEIEDNNEILEKYGYNV